MKMRFFGLALVLLSDAGQAACPTESIMLAVGNDIQAAVESAPAGATFCLATGVHRLQSISPKKGQKFHGETINAVLTGSRVLTRFTRDGDLYVASGQTQEGIVRGECASGTICSRPEALFINGASLRQVTHRIFVRPGTFYFDYNADQIYLADDPTGKIVEASAVNFAFNPSSDDVHIEDLTVEKYSSPAQEGAIQGEGRSGWVVKGCIIRWNSGTGVSVGTKGIIKGSRIVYNGQQGVTAGGTGILVDSNEIAYNNTAGFDMYWEAGGAKITESNGVVFRYNYVHHNFGPGLWTDEDVYSALYEGNTVEFNEGAGLFHEISYSAVIRNNILKHNGLVNKGWVWGADIQIAAAQDVEAYGNTITTRPGGAAIVLIDQNRSPDEFGGYYRTQNNYLHHNNITCHDGCSFGGVSDAAPNDENYSIIETGNNRFDHNTLYGGEILYLWGHSQLDFRGFRQQGQELRGQEHSIQGAGEQN